MVTAPHSSQCAGSIPVSTKVDAGMLSLLDEAAEARGLCRAEVVRLALDALEASERGGLRCPECSDRLELM